MVMVRGIVVVVVVVVVVGSGVGGTVAAIVVGGRVVEVVLVVLVVLVVVLLVEVVVLVVLVVDVVIGGSVDVAVVADGVVADGVVAVGGVGAGVVAPSVASGLPVATGVTAIGVLTIVTKLRGFAVAIGVRFFVVVVGVDRSTVAAGAVGRVVPRVVAVGVAGDTLVDGTPVVSIAALLFVVLVVVLDAMITFDSLGLTTPATDTSVGTGTSVLVVVVVVDATVEELVGALEPGDPSPAEPAPMGPAPGECCSTTTVVSTAGESAGLVIHQSAPPSTNRQIAPTATILDFVHPTATSSFGDSAWPTCGSTFPDDFPSSGRSVAGFSSPATDCPVVPDTSLCLRMVCAVGPEVNGSAGFG
jgi:hypothetical protein